jgi:hypothetical protein
MSLMAMGAFMLTACVEPAVHEEETIPDEDSANGVATWTQGPPTGVSWGGVRGTPDTRRYEEDPWLSDWTNDAPYYRPGPPCDGYAARIGERTFASLSQAIDQAQPWDVLVLCPGEHYDPITVGSTRPLEIRGLTGDPSDVVWSPPMDPIRPSHAAASDLPFAEDTDQNWVRLSGLTLGAQLPENTNRAIEVSASRIEVRDIELRNMSLILYPDTQAVSDRVESSIGGWGTISVNRPEDHVSGPMFTTFRSLRGGPTVAGLRSGLRVLGYLFGKSKVTIRDTMLESGDGFGVTLTGQSGSLAPNPALELEVDIERVRVVGGELADPEHFSDGVEVLVQTSRDNGECRAHLKISESSFENLAGVAVAVLGTWTQPGEFDCDPGSPLIASFDDVSFYRNRMGVQTNERATLNLQDVDLGTGPRDNSEDFYGCPTDYGLLPSATLRPASSYCPDL